MASTGIRRRHHQPAPPVPPEIAAAVEQAMAAVAPVRRDKALPLLQQIQARLGSLPAAALAHASRLSRIPLADLHALVSFYDLLTAEPRGQSVLYVCDDLVCRCAGKQPAPAPGQTVVHMPCLGQCDRGPAALAISCGAWQVHALPPTRTGWPAGYVPLLLGRTDGPAALECARAMAPARLIGLVKASRLVGRGGAAFPTGIKWEAVAGANTPLGPGPDGALKYVVVNADESEPGTFTNRHLMETDPRGVVCSALVAAHAVDAGQVYLYIRGEYPLAIERISAAISAVDCGDVNVEVRCGSGAYVCGEETALFASIEGERGEPRVKPPFPTTAGLFGRPTLINNVETLYNLLPLLHQGVDAWNAVQPKLFSISGHVVRPGVYELPLGAPLSGLIELAGGPTGEIQAVLMGGAAGMFIGPDQLDTPLDFQAMAAVGATLGSGAVMVFDTGTDLWDLARRAARFFAEESCGKCVPCRLGTARQAELTDRFAAGDTQGVPLHRELGQVMADAAICGLGQTATNAVRSLLALRPVDGAAIHQPRSEADAPLPSKAGQRSGSEDSNRGVKG